MGTIVQIVSLWLFRAIFGIPALPAAALAIELAIVHNFFWHARWTWVDRAVESEPPWLRLIRYNVLHSGTAILNLGVMAALIDLAHLHYLAANLLAVIACSLLNYVLSNRVIFSLRDGKPLWPWPAR